jgi:gluconate 2-dehydrogenase gamma chain
MKRAGVTRRHFIGGVGGTISSVWLSSRWPAILTAQEHVHNTISQGKTPGLQSFTAVQAALVEALSAQIIPTDDTPGAKEAGVVYFIDKALATFDKESLPAYVRGLQIVETTTKKLFPRAEAFTELKADQQIAVMKSIEKTKFFGLLRTHTVIGFMADPEYGGNRDKAGWKLIGFEDRSAFRPPFGYYDQTFKPAGEPR